MKAARKAVHPIVWITLGLSVVSAALFLWGLLLPPAGEVHASVLKGLGIMTANITLVNLSYAISSGKTATFKHGNTTATVGGSKRKKETTE
jgi:hypothetical protein